MRAVILALFLSGCMTLRPAPRLHRFAALASMSDDECKAVDRKYVGWTVGAAVLGAASSGGAGVAGLVKSQPTSEILAGSAAGIGALGVAAGYLASFYAARYTNRCTTGAK